MTALYRRLRALADKWAARLMPSAATEEKDEVSA